MGSWLKRTRSVNIVREQSNQLKTKQKARKENTLKKKRKNIPGSALWNLVTDRCAQSHRTTGLGAKFRSPESDPRPESGPRERLGTKAPPQDAAYGWAGTCCRRRPPAVGGNRTRSEEVAPFKTPLHRSQAAGRAPAVPGACCRSSGTEVLPQGRARGRQTLSFGSPPISADALNLAF